MNATDFYVTHISWTNYQIQASERACVFRPRYVQLDGFVLLFDAELY
jgi:hypothetical protein